MENTTLIECAKCGQIWRDNQMISSTPCCSSIGFLYGKRIEAKQITINTNTKTIQK